MRASSIFAMIQAFCAYTMLCAAQSVVRVDAADIQADLTGRPLGINLNYLTDRPSLQADDARPLTAALQELGVHFLRYPGGEKADTYLWSTPPFQSSHPSLARTGPKDFWSQQRQFVADDGKTLRDPMNFDQFMQICRSIRCAPSVVVNHDSYLEGKRTAESTAPTRAQLLDTAAAWVRYSVAHHYNVRLWEIGNETYMDSYNGPKQTVTGYAEDVSSFSRAMKAEDSGILIGANGASYPWFHELLRRSSKDIDFLVVHAYPCCASYKEYQNKLFFDDAIKAARLARAELPPAEQKRLGIAVTEINALDFYHKWADTNDLGHALLLFEILGQYLWFDADASCVDVWNTRWIENNRTDKPASIFDALDTRNQLNPSGRVLAIWGAMQGGHVVKSYWPGGDGQVTAYSVIDAHRKLNIAIVNRDLHVRTTQLKLENWTGSTQAQTHVYTGTGPDDQHPVYRLSDELLLSNGYAELRLPAVSITVLSFSTLPAQGTGQ